MELASHQVPHFLSSSSPVLLLRSSFVLCLNPSPSGLHTPNQNTMCRLCKHHQRPFWAEINSLGSITSQAYYAVPDYPPECWAVRESSFRPSFCFPLVCSLSTLSSMERILCYFERYLAWQACGEMSCPDLKMSSLKLFMPYISFWSQEVGASTPKLFLAGLRASLSLWISVCKMGLTVVHAFVGTSL